MVNETSGCQSQTLVIPGDADNSYLYKKLIGTHECGVLMPKNQGSLSDSNLTKIRTWIEEGALNN